MEKNMDHKGNWVYAGVRVVGATVNIRLTVGPVRADTGAVPLVV